MRGKFRLASAVSVITAGVLALVACGEAPEDDNGDNATPGGDAQEYQACMVTDIGGIDDRSFNASAWQGLQDAAAENPAIVPDNVSSAAESDYVPNLTSYVERQCDFILAVGGLMTEQTRQVAEENPDQQFAIVDSDPGVPNVYPMQFDTAQAAFLAGYLAAGYTTSGTVATYGGEQIGSVTIFMDGFVDGVAYYNEQNDADVEALGWDKDDQEGSFTDSFTDQAAGKALSDTFVAQGADVILPVAGGAGLGTADGALASGGEYVVIWVDVDGCESAEQYCETFLTTVVKNMPFAVREAAVAGAAADGFLTGGFLGTLENDGVSLAPYHEFEDDISEELKTDIIELQADIIDGTVEVTSPAQPR